MNLTRRQALGLSAGAVTLAFTGFSAPAARADVAEARKLIADFSGGREPQPGKITLTAPEIAENGNTVPVSVSVESAMTGEDRVDSILILAEENPNPGVATLHFTELSGAAAATVRMRLAKTQNVVAVAKMSDGSVYKDTRQVKVTIGGCGG